MKVRSVLAVAGSMAAAATVFTAAPASASPAAAPSGCATGNVCFYTGSNYSGSMCDWDVADPDTTSGSISCSWMREGTEPKSVYNNGTSADGSTGVAYYWKTNYKGGRIGCTKNGSGGNISGDYVPMSLKWVSNKCG
ncbi:peptidase inhibitor family I36 protein [Streptomyces sulphureus]|uniref:peptidase inhibitor family I36 protein n=1 Tax=Streptomyces sulphureus TaxID=47758 RepID=UPI00036C3F3C|nr:peptidase inhibitor family I36 protein [Streptomyces sulphureus]